MKASETVLAKELAELWTDGACKGNPGGEGGAGIILKLPGGGEIIQKGYYLGIVNSNEAEYLALVKGLELAVELEVQYLKIRTDSELMWKQVHGVVNCKADNIVPLRDRIWELMAEFTEVELMHVLRNFNAGADRIATRAAETKRDSSKELRDVRIPSSLKPIEAQG